MKRATLLTLTGFLLLTVICGSVSARPEQGLADKPAIIVIANKHEWSPAFEDVMEKDLRKAGLKVTDDPAQAGIWLGIDSGRVKGHGVVAMTTQLQAFGPCQFLKTGRMGLGTVWQGQLILEVAPADTPTLKWMLKQWRGKMLPEFLKKYREANPS